ncbi:MAG: hypothetical protein AAF446_04445 [Pseudomonadota bacterium]
MADINAVLQGRISTCSLAVAMLFSDCCRLQCACPVSDKGTSRNADHNLESTVTIHILINDDFSMPRITGTHAFFKLASLNTVRKSLLLVLSMRISTIQKRNSG